MQNQLSMQEPMFESENLTGSSMRDLKGDVTKSTQKKVLVDVKNRLALTPLSTNFAGALKPHPRTHIPSTPAFGKGKTTSSTSSACKPAVGKKLLSNSSGTSPVIFVEDEQDVPEVFGLPEGTDEYEDLMPKSERYTNNQIHKLANFWDSIQLTTSSNSTLKEPEPVNVPTPELQPPELDRPTLPTAWLRPKPLPLPSFQIWEDTD